MDEQNGEQNGKKSGWSALGKSVLGALKDTASEKIDETKRDLYAAGDDLLDRLVLQLKYIAFLIVAGVLVIVGGTLGLSEQFHIPFWMVALGAGFAVWLAGLIWKAKNIPTSAPQAPAER